MDIKTFFAVNESVSRLDEMAAKEIEDREFLIYMMGKLMEKYPNHHWDGTPGSAKAWPANTSKTERLNDVGEWWTPVYWPWDDKDNAPEDKLPTSHGTRMKADPETGEKLGDIRHYVVDALNWPWNEGVGNGSPNDLAGWCRENLGVNSGFAAREDVDNLYSMEQAAAKGPDKGVGSVKKATPFSFDNLTGKTPPMSAVVKQGAPTPPKFDVEAMKAALAADPSLAAQLGLKPTSTKKGPKK